MPASLPHLNRLGRAGPSLERQLREAFPADLFDHKEEMKAAAVNGTTYDTRSESAQNSANHRS